MSDVLGHRGAGAASWGRDHLGGLDMRGDLGRRLQGRGLQQLHPGTAITNPLLLHSPMRRAAETGLL